MDETIEQEDECSRVKRCKGEADEETAPADEETAMMPPPAPADEEKAMMPPPSALAAIGDGLMDKVAYELHVARRMDEELESICLESAMRDGEAEAEESEWAARLRREKALRRALSESARMRVLRKLRQQEAARWRR